MAVFHQFHPEAAATSRLYFNGEMDINELNDFDTSQSTVLVLGIKDGEDCRSAAAIWGTGWNGLPAKEAEDLLGEYTIPTLNGHWVDWDELLPGSTTN